MKGRTRENEKDFAKNKMVTALPISFSLWDNCEGCVFSANERWEGERKGKEEEGKGERERELEVKLWQKRKKSQTPQLGTKPGTPANAADRACKCYVTAPQPA